MVPGYDAANVRKGLWAAAIGGLLFTLDLPLLRLAGLDLWTLVFGRGLFLFVSILAGWILLRRKSGERRPFIAGKAGVATAIATTLAPITYISAIANTSAANVVFLVALIPLMTAVFSRVFLGEKARWITWAAILAALAGVTIIVSGSFGTGQLFGDVMAFASALCTAIAFTIMRASPNHMATSLAAGSLLSAIVALAFFGATPSALGHLSAFGQPAWLWLGLDGFVAIPIALTLAATSPKFLPSTDVSMFFLLETVLTPVWIWLLNGEVPTHRALLGGLLIVATLCIHSFWRLKSTMRTG